MVAFRKLFPVLVLVALLLGTAVMANAQATGTPLRCTANAGVPPIVRAEGYTELTGDLVVECTGGNPNQPFQANFQIFLNTNITSRLLSDTLSEATLLIDEPGLDRTLRNGATGLPTPFCLAGVDTASTCNPASADVTYQHSYPTVYRAIRGSQPNQTIGGQPIGNENLVVWPNVTVVPPGSNLTRVFRFTNIRANAAGLGAAQTLVPTQVVAYISVFPQNTLPIDNPQQTVGYVQTGMVFDVRTCSNGSATLPFNANQCQALNRDWFNDPNRGSSFSSIGGLRFREGFQTAFKTRIADLQWRSLPGQVFNTESGFMRNAAYDQSITTGNLGRAGEADAGTRLAARFVNFPTNARLFVTTQQVGFGISTATARLVTTDAVGATGGTSGIGFGFLPVNSGTTLNCPVTVSNEFGVGQTDNRGVPAAEIALTNGAGIAVWEVTGANQSAIDTLFFYFGVAYASNVSAGAPGLGTANVIGNLAPFYGSGPAERMSQTLSIPRFATNSASTGFFRINQCVTNLLFPYVTNWAGFDTGMAIANTSQDPFGSPADRLQSGKCTINYYGRLANGNPPTTTKEETDREVGAGETLTFILSGGGTYGLKGNPNFQGYIIAQCGFLYGHGFAFITDGPIGQARVAEGYLALVLDGPDSSGRLRGNTLGEVRGH